MFKIHYIGYFLLTFILAIKALPTENNDLNPVTTTAVTTEEHQSSLIETITVSGNKTITTNAILALIKSKEKTHYQAKTVTEDVKTLLNTGYFYDVYIEKQNNLALIIHVVERPTINEIIYEGFNAVTSSSLKDKIVSKQYNILDEKKVSQDLKSIETSYQEKGYYLAKATYRTKKINETSANLIYSVNENTPIIVRKINLIGNDYFSDFELKSIMGTRSFSWLSFLNSSGIYKDDYLAADQNNIAYYYRDNGYAEATVATPTTNLDKNRNSVDVFFYIEQGERFTIGDIKITGDLIEDESKIKEILSLKENETYRISKFSADMKKLKNYYGDKGYAFAYIYPAFNIDRKEKKYNITYNITKGSKAYFRKITVEGNIKTRDNVVRREIKVGEGSLYNSSQLESSRAEIERLGFFEKVELNQADDPKNQAVDLKITVKEKSTGQLQASIGASPNSGSGGKIAVFGNLNYQEKNFFGKGYSLGANLQMSPSQEKSGKLNYSLGLNFYNPSIQNGPWSFGTGVSYSYQIEPTTDSNVTDDFYIVQKNSTFNLSIGREIIDHLRFTLGYGISNYMTSPSSPLTARYYQSGKSEEVSQSLTYDQSDDQLNPTSGYYLNVTNTIGIKTLYGQYSYGTLTGNFIYYLPFYYTDSFKTNFRFVFNPSYVYQLHENEPVPYWKLLKLGNSFYMKGYTERGETISPTKAVTTSPSTGKTINVYTGGNRSFYGAAEYFVPLIPEAGLRFVTFGEAGTVLDDYDTFSVSDVKYDVGFGFRWTTPIAPFRFEWAFPVKHGKLGNAHFIFTIGYDNFGMN